MAPERAFINVHHMCPSQETRQYQTGHLQTIVVFKFPFQFPFSNTENPPWRGINVSLHRQVTGYQSPNICPTAVSGMRAVLCTGQYMLYFDCQFDPVLLTKHLRGTRKSQFQKKSASHVPLGCS